MIEYLIKYVQAEAHCSKQRATEVAYYIMDEVDMLIHNRIDEEEDDY